MQMAPREVVVSVIIELILISPIVFIDFIDFIDLLIFIDCCIFLYDSYSVFQVAPSFSLLFALSPCCCNCNARDHDFGSASVAKRCFRARATVFG